MRRSYFTAGCLVLISLLIGCQQSSREKPEDSKEKQLKMKETSELAALMREMQNENLDMKEQILSGKIPEYFPENFRKIHNADATPGLKEDTAVFNALAAEYLKHIDKLTSSGDIQQAKISYNNMIMTCESCHQITCQGTFDCHPENEDTNR